MSIFLHSFMNEQVQFAEGVGTSPPFLSEDLNLQAKEYLLCASSLDKLAFHLL